MTVNADAARFVHTIRQKSDADGKLLPIWSWKLQQDGITVAFGEHRSEQQALLAAQAAERNFGSGLKVTQLAQS